MTFIRITPKGPQVATVTHPNLDVAKTLHDALHGAGVHVRLWDGQTLITPKVVDLSEINLQAACSGAYNWPLSFWNTR